MKFGRGGKKMRRTDEDPKPNRAGQVGLETTTDHPVAESDNPPTDEGIATHEGFFPTFSPTSSIIFSEDFFSWPTNVRKRLIRQCRIRVGAKPSHYLHDTGVVEIFVPISSVPVMGTTTPSRIERLNFRQVRLLKENKAVLASEITKPATPLKKSKKKEVPREGNTDT
ncbi:hypothetical protein LguiB_031818 [Lonicera macranthoides]